MIATPWLRLTALAVLAFAGSTLVLILLRPLLPIDETRYLTVAWEMWLGGSKIVPHLNGEVYSHKPPMLFWLINLVWLATGPAELAARLVAPAFGAISVVLTAVLARRLWPEDPSRAGFAALTLATSGVFLAFGSATMFDTMLTVATLVAVMAIWVMSMRPGLGVAIWLGTAIAFGVLAKGPVIFVHMLPVAALMPVWAVGETRSPLRRYYVHLGLSLGIAAVLVSLWLVPVYFVGDKAYLYEITWKQSAGRAVDSFAHKRPVWFFVALMPLFLWPWGWRSAAIAGLRTTRLPSAGSDRFLLVWLASAVAAFSVISGKQLHYLVPEMAALALIVSGILPTGEPRWARVLSVLPSLGLALAGALAFAGVVTLSGKDQIEIGLIELVAATAMAGALLVLSLAFRNTLVLFSLVGPVSLIALETILDSTLERQNDPAPLALALAERQNGGIATTNRNYAGQFTFSARLTTPITKLAAGKPLEDWIDTHPAGALIALEAVANPRLKPAGTYPLQRKDWFLYDVVAPD